MPPLIAIGLYQIATSWATELICDLQALHRFGPAAVASLAECFEVIGNMELLTPTHPPGLLRVRLLLDQIGTVNDPRLNSIVAPWADRIPPTVTLAEGWAQYLAEIFVANRASLNAAVSVLATTAYEFENRTRWVHAIADRLAAGLPGRECLSNDGVSLELSERADVVNAAWLARVEDATTPFDQLAEKTLESVEFVRKWLANGGDIPSAIKALRSDVDTVLAAEAGLSILPEDCLLSRMQLDDESKGVMVAPALSLPKGTGLDLRLGTRFIVFRRTATASFDPLAEEDDPPRDPDVRGTFAERKVNHPEFHAPSGFCEPAGRSVTCSE
jgi:hypothetical protein